MRAAEAPAHKNVRDTADKNICATQERYLIGTCSVASGLPSVPFHTRSTLSWPPATMILPSGVATAEYMKSDGPSKVRTFSPVSLTRRTWLSPEEVRA